MNDFKKFIKEIKKGKLCAVWEHRLKDGESLEELEKAITYEHTIDIYDKQIAIFESIERAQDYISYLDTIVNSDIYYYITE